MYIVTLNTEDVYITMYSFLHEQASSSIDSQSAAVTLCATYIAIVLEDASCEMLVIII